MNHTFTVNRVKREKYFEYCAHNFRFYHSLHATERSCCYCCYCCCVKSAMCTNVIFNSSCWAVIWTIVFCERKHTTSQGDQRKFTWYCKCASLIACNVYSLMLMANVILVQIRKHTNCHLTFFPFRFICMRLCSFGLIIIARLLNCSN